MIAAGTAIVLVPAIPLVPLLFLTQVANAVLLLPLLVAMTRLGRDPDVLGPHANGRRGHTAALAALSLVTVSVAALGLLAVLH